MVLKPPTGPDSYRDNEKVVTNTIADELRILRDSTRKNIPALLSDLRNQIINQSTTVTTEHSGPQLRLRSRPGDGPVIAKLKSTDTINLTGNSSITTDSDRDGKPSKHVWLEAIVGTEKGWLSSEYLNKLGLHVPAPITQTPTPITPSPTNVANPATTNIGPTNVSNPATTNIGPTNVSNPATTNIGPTNVSNPATPNIGPANVANPATPNIGPSIIAPSNSGTPSPSIVNNNPILPASNNNATSNPANNTGPTPGTDWGETWYDLINDYL